MENRSSHKTRRKPPAKSCGVEKKVKWCWNRKEMSCFFCVKDQDKLEPMPFLEFPERWTIMNECLLFFCTILCFYLTSVSGRVCEYFSLSLCWLGLWRTHAVYKSRSDAPSNNANAVCLTYKQPIKIKCIHFILLVSFVHVAFKFVDAVHPFSMQVVKQVI